MRNLTPKEKQILLDAMKHYIDATEYLKSLLSIDDSDKLTHPCIHPKSGGNFFPRLKTSEIIGKEYGVTGRTIKNDEQFSQAVDKVAAELGNEAKQAILSGQAGVNLSTFVLCF